jgi:hypothetical protein
LCLLIFDQLSERHLDLEIMELIRIINGFLTMFRGGIFWFSARGRIRGIKRNLIRIFR